MQVVAISAGLASGIYGADILISGIKTRPTKVRSMSIRCPSETTAAPEFIASGPGCCTLALGRLREISALVRGFDK